MGRPTKALLDSAALINNLKTLQGWSGAFFCPMVKANAYGHGDVQVARVLADAGVEHVGVALIEEAVRLRGNNFRPGILVFAPIFECDLDLLVQHQLIPVVSRMEDLLLLKKKISSPLNIHLKFNTGMQRMGFDASDVAALREELSKTPHLKVAGVCTHFSHGEDWPESEAPTAKQFERWQAMAREFGGVWHAHKSASLVAGANAKRAPDEIGSRPGISLYGLPYEGRLTHEFLRPVLNWQTEIVRVHEIEKGAGVSYGARWVAPRRSWIGVVPVGYGDGYMRRLSNRGQMLFREQRVPVVGTVCMDYTLLDLTAAVGNKPPQPGEAVVLIGQQGSQRIDAVDVAEWADTISYEVVTAISARVRREVV